MELVVSTQASTDYTLRDSTISDLGDTACRTVRGDVLCSDWHAAMNVAFVWFGTTLALGALLLARRVLPGRTGRASAMLWCVSGLGSIGVGLVPVNEHGGLHGLVALPIFVAQPIALVLMGVSLRSRSTLVVAAASAVGVMGFVLLLRSDVSSFAGTFERLALWPGYVWVSVVALATADRRSGTRGGTRASAT